MSSKDKGIEKVKSDISKAKLNIKDLCETVNIYDKKLGGNGRKVRAEDYSECLSSVEEFVLKGSARIEELEAELSRVRDVVSCLQGR